MPNLRAPGGADEAAGGTGGLLWLLLSALVVKAVVLVQLHGHPLFQPTGDLDPAAYVNLARRVVDGNFLLRPGAFFVSPLYVYFLALVLFLTGGSLLAVKITQILLGVATIGLIHATARQWFGGRAAIAAGALAVATGLFTFYEVLLLQAALDPFLTALDLYLVTRAMTRRRPGAFVAAGFVLGLHALNRPNVLPYAAVLALGILWADRRRGGWRHAACVACGVLVAVAPVTLRNYQVTGEPIAISSHGGLNFYIGNNPEADGTYHAVAGITPSILGQAIDTRRLAETAEGRRLSEREVSAYFYRLAWEWMASHPGDALRLLGRKIAYVFNQTHLTLNNSYAYYSRDEPTLLRALIVGPGLLVPLGLVGLWARRVPSAPSGFWIWAAFIPVYALTVAAFFVSGRYQLPLLLPLCVGAGAAMSTVTAALRHKAFFQLRHAALVIVVLASAANWDFGLDEGRSEERTAMVLNLIERGEYEPARALIVRWEHEHPQPGALHYRVGRMFQVTGDRAEAIAHFRRALDIDPGQAEIRFHLGQALLDAGRPDEAVLHLEAARRAGVRPDVAGFDLARALAAAGRREQALVVLEAVVPSSEAAVRDWLALGDLARELAHPSLAERFFRQAVAHAPGLAAAREQLGLALALLGRADEAISELEEACRLDPSSPSARLNLAVLYLGHGRRDEARSQLERALALRPNYPRAHELLNKLDSLPRFRSDDRRR